MVEAKQWNIPDEDYEEEMYLELEEVINGKYEGLYELTTDAFVTLKEVAEKSMNERIKS